MRNESWLTSNAFITQSGVFVDLFFILSGFVIYHNYKDRLYDISSRKEFIIKRLKRLLPLHYFTILVIVLLEVVKFATHEMVSYSQTPFTSNSFNSLWPQLFLLNSTPFFTNFSWNGQNWSISAEIISYIIFLFTSIWCFRKKKLTIITATILIVLGYLFFFFKFGRFNLVIDFGFSFIRAFIGFYIGILIYLLRDYFNLKLDALSNHIYTFLELISIILVITAISNSNFFIEDSYYIIHLAFAFLIFIFSMEKGMFSIFFRYPLFQKLGAWSYSIYLNHIFIIVLYNMIVLKLIGISGENAFIFEVLTTIVLCIYSYLTYNYIEKRFYTNLNK